MTRQTTLILELLERVKKLEHEAELMRTVLIVKEPTTIQAAQAYDGLRKQVVAGAAERRSHLVQLVSMAVAVSRATSVEDLAPQLREWMAQAGVEPVSAIEPEDSPRDFFEDLSGEGLAGPIEIVEPAYIDSHTGALLRLGRARRRAAAPATSVGDEPTNSKEVIS